MKLLSYIVGLLLLITSSAFADFACQDFQDKYSKGICTVVDSHCEFTNYIVSDFREGDIIIYYYEIKKVKGSSVELFNGVVISGINITKKPTGRLCEKGKIERGRI